MSFVNEIKQEIIEYWQKKSCCRQSEAYGMVLFSVKDDDISLKTRNPLVSHHFKRLIKKCFNYDCNTDSLYVNLSKASLPLSYDYRNYNFECDNCLKAFIRGAFLVCGQCSDPMKDYMLEFIVYNEDLSLFLQNILSDFGIEVKRCQKTVRSVKRYSVYLKNSASIEDLLTLMGAQNNSLKLMECKIMKDVRNDINRKTNFETANIRKSSESCAKQLEAINKLEKSDRLITLPEDLYELALFRRDNIDISLSEVGKKFGLSKAGVHHRLKKIIEKADSLE